MTRRDRGRGAGEPVETQRLDKWLWFARVVRTRTLAERLVEDGFVRLNGARALDGAKRIRPGDVLTVALERDVRVLRVLALAERRGPYSCARALFEDLSTPAGPDRSGPHRA